MNCLENDSLLLEARPLANQLKKAMLASTATAWQAEDMATMASCMGYLGVIDAKSSQVGGGP